MLRILDALRASAPFHETLRLLRSGRLARAEGLWGGSMALLAAAVALEERRLVLCVLPHVEQAEEFAEDIQLFAPGLAAYFPPWETLGEDELPDADIMSQRVTLLRQLFHERADGEAGVVVAPVQAVLQQVVSPESIESNTLDLACGDSRSPEAVAEWLMERDFRHVPQVSEPGEFSRRGGILDVFPYVAELPVRIEFFGDEVDSLRAFDPDTQTSVTPMNRCRITAVVRKVGQASSLSKGVNGASSKPGDGQAGSLSYGGAGQAGSLSYDDSIFRYLPDDAILALAEPAETMEGADTLARELGGGEVAAGLGALREASARFASLHMSALPGAFGEGALEMDVRSTERFGPSVERVVAELSALHEAGRRVLVFCNNEAERSRLAEMLDGTGILGSDRFEARVGRLNRGFDWPELGAALLSNHELFQRYRVRRPAAARRQSQPIDSFASLEPGDLVVHVAHGIARFEGMELLETQNGPKRDCLRLRFDEGAILYVPASKVELVQKYIGPSEARPRLSRLGSKAWGKAKDRAQAACMDAAAELLRTAAVRASQPGRAHPPDAEWQREFEQSFIYEETEDQLIVAEAIKEDLEAPRPMDRLVCGDVGYGKTELAMRAAFKVVLGGAQVAVLAPTTVLAMQHWTAFRERMADYPVVVEMLSRFRTKGEQAETLAKLKDGAVDIVIGTHRLIQRDVAFRDLGLVIVDEEQRFGVAQKEALKQMRESVDVLTLTATPIPRTLHMSLVGLRDISSLETPPRDRLAIQTRLWRYDPHRIRQAVLRELAREGQTFFVHNRVENIQSVAAQVRSIVPEARVLVGHGQMGERELERVMRQFIAREADVLVCTTIIESGLDIPSANTILIHEADRFGLSQMHQLRGRVGRYKHRAYAYMLLPEKRPLTPVASRRLKALEEFSDLGAGFRIAMRDLEIRGAGNILGAEQSGHIAAVGYEMYRRLLDTAVRRLTEEAVEDAGDEGGGGEETARSRADGEGEETARSRGRLRHSAHSRGRLCHTGIGLDERGGASLSLGVEAYLPGDYVRDPGQRMDLYRRLNRAASEADVNALATELADRFGLPPPKALALLDETRLRIRCEQAKINGIVRDGRSVTFDVASMSAASQAMASLAPKLRPLDERTIYLRLESASAPPELVMRFLLRSLAPEVQAEAS